MACAFYLGQVEEGPLLQGDLFPGIPFPRLTLSQCDVLTGGKLQEINFLRSGAPATDSHCVLPYDVDWGIVVTQSCDLQQHPGKLALPITLAPVAAYSSIGSLMKVAPHNRSQRIIDVLLDRSKHPNQFPLGPYFSPGIDFRGGMVNLNRLVSLEGSDLPALQGALRLRLGPLALQAFQERIGGAFSRTALPPKEGLLEFLGLPVELHLD